MAGGRGGNDAPWKAWKTQKASFPLFPPGLEIRQKAAGFPHFHRAGDGFYPQRRREENAVETEFQLTDPGHFKHDRRASVASLRRRPG
jgi:hypothetical protein